MRCKNAELLHKVGVPKLGKDVPVTFSLYSDLDNCVAINTRDYTDISALDHYAMYDRPANQYDCDGGYCTNTGTLYVDIDDSGSGDNDAFATFYKAMDATEYASGIITMYVKLSSVNTGDKAVVKLSDASTFADSDTYEVELGTADADGYVPVLVDLTATPDATTGDGWEASNSGVFVEVAVMNGSSYKEFGISTISFFKSLYDLAMNAIVQVSCLTEAGGTFDIAALERTCLSSGYDKTALDSGIEQTVTGTQVTSNYWMLNPLAGMDRFSTNSETTEGYRIETVKKTIGDDGTVEIVDMSDQTCDFIGAQIDDKCVTPTADMLYRIQSPVAVTLGYDQFQVLPSESGHVFYFSTDLAGKDVLITYPQKVELKERIVGKSENVGKVRAKMSYPWEYSDGTEEIHTFGNVLITSFPASISNEDSEFTFTITIFPDSDDEWFTRQRVLA